MRLDRLRGTVAAGMAAAALAAVLPVAAQGASTFGWGNSPLGVEHPAEFGAYPVVEPAPNPLSGVSSMGAGSQFALADSGGTVYDWGSNGKGQLGDGTLTSIAPPTAVSGLGPVRAVAAGPLASYALMEGGTVEVWGANGEGQLGQGSNTGPETCTQSTPCSKSPLAVHGLSHVAALSVGGSHALVLLEDGTVEAWGANSRGQLGDGTTVEKDSPVVVAGLSGVVAVAAGQQFSLALLGNGEVRAWGANESGQLGDGATLDSHTPVAVTGLAEVSALAAGGFHALALLANGEVRSWGADNDGQLGNGVSGTNSDVPVAVGGLSGVTGVAAGRFESFAILSGGQVDGWGSNNVGQLGDGAERTVSVSPTALACDLHGIEGIATYDEAAFAWGAAQETCPGIGGVVPSEGPAAGGTEVTITGSEFGSASAVSFGSTPASSVSFESPTEIKVVAPAGSETVDVRVTNAKGTSAPNLKDHFTYAGLPTVTNVSSDVWRAGQTVEVTGTNLGNATELHFGSIAAPLFRVLGSHEIAVVVPSGGAGVVDVTATNPTATSVANPGDEFMYETSPEFGRCVKLSGGTYSDKSCSIEGEQATPYNWYPAAFGAHPLEHPGVQIGSGALTVETPAKLKLVCTTSLATGKVTAYDVISIEHLTLTGCSAAKLGGACTSSGASAGEVRANPISARLGMAEKKKGVFVPALQWEPASGEVLAQMTCGAHTVALTGSFVALTGKQGAMLTTEKIQAKEKKGVPTIAGLRGQPSAGLGIEVDAEGAQSAGAKVTTTETNEEAFEIR